MNAPASDARFDGYVADTAYPDYFHREIMPLWLTSALQALGRRAPEMSQGFTWLELGCGTGISAVVAAATHPNSHFIGLDANPSAIAQAQKLAQAIGLSNVEFVCASFEQVLASHSAHGALPACDFIVAHGVYSWVSPRNRLVMQQLVQQQLKPGGVCYLAYMSQPGSAVLSAPQKLAQLYAQQVNADSSTQAQQALALLQRTAQAGAGFFVEEVRMASKIEQLASMDVRYIAHEFLNAHWDCLHVADVMQDMQAIDCDFVGSATLLENVDGASLPQSTLPLLQELVQQGKDVSVVETFKDIARNQNQRRDIYQRSHPEGNTLSVDAHRHQLLSQRVCLLPQAPDLQTPLSTNLTLDTRIGPVQISMAHIQPLLQVLQSGPCRYADLLSQPLYARQPGLVSQLLQLLCWAGWLQFMHPQTSSRHTYKQVALLNRALVDRPCGQPPLQYMAAADAGTAIVCATQLSKLQQQRLSWLGAVHATE